MVPSPCTPVPLQPYPFSTPFPLFAFLFYFIYFLNYAMARMGGAPVMVMDQKVRSPSWARAAVAREPHVATLHTILRGTEMCRRQR